MKARCIVCEWEGVVPELAIRCPGCGAKPLAPGRNAAPRRKPGEPLVGMSSVPLTGPSESELRGPMDEPLEVTRARAEVFHRLTREGSPVGVARTLAEREVPIQCGKCGGEDPGCNVCRGRATVPTERLAAERAAMKQKRPRRSSRSRPSPGGVVARVAPRD